MPRLPALQRLKTGALGVLRSRSETTYLLPPSGTRFGNHLYRLLRAHLRDRQGERALMVRPPDLESWLRLVPDLMPLTAPREQMRLWDRRDLYHYQRWGTDYDEGQIHDFCRSRILTSPELLDALAQVDPEDVAVNVRRGDYYSVPEFRGYYSFDIAAYLEAAGELIGGFAGKSVTVVSDDPQWCRERLRFPGADVVRFGSPTRPGALTDLALVAGARVNILTNSTFSYWGAHLRDARLGVGQGVTVVPAFHRRGAQGGRSWHLNPRWRIVEDIPGGWDS